MLFTIGDYLAGALVGVATALAVRLVIWPGADMVIAMMIGMGLGTIVHLVIGLLLTPCLGMFETMMPTSLIGMYGGMFFAMRDSMMAGSPTVGACLAVGAIFGAVVTLGMKIYNKALRGPVFDTGE
jgi:hypothetical protein